MGGLNLAKGLFGLFIGCIIVCFVWIMLQDHKEGIAINQEIRKSIAETTHVSSNPELLITLKQTSSAFSKITLLIIGGFMLVLVGCLLVLLGIEASYKLSIAHNKVKSNLMTTSPGLVVVTLGAILLVVISIKDYHTKATIPTRIPVQIVNSHDRERDSLILVREKLLKKITASKVHTVITGTNSSGPTNGIQKNGASEPTPCDSLKKDPKLPASSNVPTTTPQEQDKKKVPKSVVQSTFMATKETFKLYEELRKLDLKLLEYEITSPIYPVNFVPSQFENHSYYKPKEFFFITDSASVKQMIRVGLIKPMEKIQ